MSQTEQYINDLNILAECDKENQYTGKDKRRNRRYSTQVIKVKRNTNHGKR